MNRGQIRKVKRHSQELFLWMIKFNMIHERRIINDAIESIFSITSDNYDVLQRWESEVA